jgi:hypothetical protein
VFSSEFGTLVWSQGLFGLACIAGPNPGNEFLPVLQIGAANGASFAGSRTCRTVT